MSIPRALSLAGLSLHLAFGAAACIALGVLEEPPTPSGAITAIPIEESASTATRIVFPTLPPAWTKTPHASQSTSGDESPTAGTPVEDTATAIPEEGPTSETEVAPTSGAVNFQIDQAESEARFSLGEILRGEPNLVVGVADQVVGDIAIDFDDLSVVQVGVVQINARTFVTVEALRNRSIQNRILFTEQYEFITFSPTSLSGLPDAITFGEPATLQITGDLMITDITNEVTFEVQVTPGSETRLEGLASTVIRRADYEITIPSVYSVAEVDEEVLLEIDFVALASG